MVIPNDYIHGFALKEVAELLHYSLLENNKKSAITINRIDENATNIIFGIQHLSQNSIASLPVDTIVFNTEPINDPNVECRQKILPLINRHTIWEYSPENIKYLNSIGCKNVRLVDFGFQQQLKRIISKPNQDIDILFYGSLNERRTIILDQLRAAGCKVEHVFGVYGEDRDILVSRSKVVLNVYYYNLRTFDVVRLFYLMTNKKAIVTEACEDFSISQKYLHGIKSAHYEELVNTCLELVKNDAKREELEASSLKTIRLLPQKSFTLDLIN